MANIQARRQLLIHKLKPAPLMNRKIRSLIATSIMLTSFSQDDHLLREGLNPSQVSFG